MLPLPPPTRPHPRMQVLYILMNGTGVGFSVEPIFVEQLPTVAERFVQTSSTVMVEDSREGWARALREIIALLYTGHVSVCWCAALLAAGLGLQTDTAASSALRVPEQVLAACRCAPCFSQITSLLHQQLVRIDAQRFLKFQPLLFNSMCVCVCSSSNSTASTDCARRCPYPCPPPQN